MKGNSKVVERVGAYLMAITQLAQREGGMIDVMELTLKDATS